MNANCGGVVPATSYQEDVYGCHEAAAQRTTAVELTDNIGASYAKLKPQKRAPIKKTKSSASFTEKKRTAKVAVTYCCQHCSFETRSIVKHVAHKRQHRDLEPGPNAFKCHNCDYSCKVKGGLQRHIKRVHTKERPFTCPVCNFRTIDKTSMAKHIIKMHKEDFGADVAIYVDCMRAGNANTSNDEELLDEAESSHVNKDETTEEEPTVTAKVVPAFNTTDKSNFESCNFAGNHTLKKRRSAVQVNKVSKNKFAYKNDTANLQQFPATQQDANRDYYRKIYATPEYREMRARKLTCEYCQKQCNSRRELLAHQNEHKDCNVHCPVCHMFIVDNAERVKHIENHFQQQPFVCCTCLSTFSEESAVILHQQIQHKKTVNVIMDCMFCPFSSRSQERYTRHMTRCHLMRSEVPKHNPFSVSKMVELIAEEQFRKVFPKDVISQQLVISQLCTEDCHEKVMVNNALGKSKIFETEKKSKLDSDITEKENSDNKNSSMLDYTLLDLTRDLDESIEDFEDLLRKAKQFHGFSCSQEDICDIIKSNEQLSLQMQDSHSESTSQSSLEQQVTDENSNDLNPSHHSGQFYKERPENPNLKHCKSQEALLKHLPIQETTEAFSNVPGASGSQNGANSVQVVKASAAVADAPEDPGPSNFITHARISSVANRLGDRKASISAINIKKMRQRKAAAVRRSRAGSLKTCPSPDSTSGVK